MLKNNMSSSNLFARIGLFFVISAMFLTITAAGANAAGFSFKDSVLAFFGASTEAANDSTSVANPFELSITRLGTGSGTVRSEPVGIVCGTVCSSSFALGTAVSLSAEPDAGSSFVGWSGDCTGSSECIVSMTQARSVSATFDHNDLVIASSGTIPPGTYRNIAFAQTGSCMSTRLGGDITVTGTMTVDACNSLDTDAHRVYGSGSFVLGDGGALYISDAYGITTPFSTVSCPVGADCGSIQTSSRSFSSLADYTYNGATDQIVGNALPSSVRNLYIVSPPSALTDTRVDGYSPQTVTGTLHITGSSSSSKKEFKGHVTLLKRGTGTCDGEIDVYNNVVIDAHGKLTLGCDVIVTGDWTMATDGELSGDYAVTFNGDTGEQDITGDTTFYKLQSGFIYATSPPSPAPLRVHGTMTISNKIVMFGGQNDLLSISGTGGGGGTPNDPWQLCAMGEREIQHISVSDSDATCSGAPIRAVDSHDNGNNQNWDFEGSLTVSNSSPSSGTVTSQPSGISCGTTCSSSFDQGSVVRLVASPAPGFEFAGWSGACTGTDPVCDVTMDSAKTATVTWQVDTTPPDVSILSTSPNPTTSSSTITWDSDEGGSYRIVGSENCDDGDIGDVIDDGTFIFGSGPRQTVISEHFLHRGSNSISVCVQDAFGNRGSATTTVQMQSCVAPDNAVGTVDLPAECRLLSGEMSALNGLPPGEPILMRSSFERPTDVSTSPGGSLGGSRSTATMFSKIELHYGSAPLRTISMPSCAVTIDSAPRSPGNPVQTFDTDMFAMQCQTTGDPDFDLLRITGGSSFGLPSPGHTTLTRSCDSGTCSWSVDSSFDLTYRVDFVGSSSGPFSGMSGSTTGTTSMSSLKGSGQFALCYTVNSVSWTECPAQGFPVTMLNGLPPGTAMMSDIVLSSPSSSSVSPGGSLGGERHTFLWSSSLSMAGTGDPDFDLLRRIQFSSCPTTIDTAPHSPGQPVQSFDTSMFAMQCQITGDPDFDLLRITSGSSFGLPSPGHTTLRQDCSSGTCIWSVDSSFDLTYQLDFVGSPGGRFSGRSGSTTGTIRIQQGMPHHALTVTKGGGGGGSVTSSPAGIDCGSQCSADFESGTVVTLSAVPSSGSSFTGWSGACTGTGDCDVTMDQARSVTATFTTPDFVVSSSGPIPPGTYRDVTYLGCFTATLSGDIVVTGTMTVASCQTLDTNGFIVFGGGSFALESGGALYIGDPNGITKRSSSVTCPNGQCGSIQTETRSYSSSADYTYNGLSNQHVGDGLPETVRNLYVVSPPSATTSTRLDGYSPQVVTGKISVSGNSSSGKKEFKGHVTLLKRPTANSPCASDDFHDVEILSGGSMTLGCDITVSGDWTMATGGQLSGDYCVTLDGDSLQTLSGSTTFSCLSKFPSSLGVSTSLSFSSGRTTVSNALNLHGDPDRPLIIGSSTAPSSSWEMCALGTRSVDYVSVSNSDASCSGPPITASNSIDGGNNLNWSFLVPTPTATNTSTPTSTPASTATNTNTPTPTPTCGGYISVSMPNLHSAANGVVTVPVTTGDVSSSGVLSSDITVTFDSSVLSLPADPTFGVSLGPVANSNGGGRVMDAFSPSSGTLRVSIYGTLPMVGGGDLVYLTFSVIGSPGTSSPLSFSLFRYNETSPCTAATNGSVTATGTISGSVIYGNPVTGPNPRGVPNVLLSSFGSASVSSVTSSLGSYSLTGFGSGSYTITPNKFGGVNNAITSFDAARVSQYVTGRITFTPAQLFVADVSSTTGVTSFDAALIARFVASLGPPQGNTGSWRFGPSSRSYTTVYSNFTGEDYFAHLMGEVSGNWGDPSSFRPTVGPERLTTVAAPNIVTTPGMEVIVPISVNGTTGKDVIAYEFDLRYDPSVIQPLAEPFDVAGTLSSSLFVVTNAETPGILRVVVYGTEPLDGSGVLLNLRFTAVGEPGTVSHLTWENILFNEGDPRVTMTHGQVEISNQVD